MSGRTWATSGLLLVTVCAAKPRLSPPVESMVFAADGSVAVAGSKQGGGARLDARGQIKPLPTVEGRRGTVTADGSAAVGAARGGFVVVPFDGGDVSTLAVSERDGEPWQLHRLPEGDLVVTKLVHHWRIHRWVDGATVDPDPLQVETLGGVWVDAAAGLYFLDTGYGLQVRDFATGRVIRVVDRRSDPQRYVDARLDAEGRLITALWDGDGFRLWAPPDSPAGLWNLNEAAPFSLGAGGGLAAVGADAGVEIRSSTGKVLELVPTKQKVVAVAMSPDGQRVAGALADGTLFVAGVDVAPTELTDREASPVDAGRVDRKRVPSGGEIRPPQQAHALPEPPRLMRWAPAGTLQGWIGQELVVVDPFTGQVDALGVKKAAPGRAFAWKRDQSALAVIEADGVGLYAPGRKAFLRLGGLATGGEHAFLDWGGDHIVVDVDATRVQAWNSESTEPVGEPFQVAGRVLTGFSVSPDGSKLATIGEDAAIYDVVARKRVGDLDGHLGRVSGVAWSADGARLASVGNDGTVILWDAGSITPTALFEGLLGQSVAFSPDGQQLLVAGATQARVIDLGSGSEALSLGFQGTLTSADWGDIGMVLTTNANMLYLWP